MKKSQVFRIMPLCMALILSGCSTYSDIETSYQQKDYPRTIQTIINASNTQASAATQKRADELLANTIAAIEAKPQSTLDQKIIKFEHIYSVRLITKNSTNPIAVAFNQRYPIDQLEKELAKDYYQLAKKQPEDTDQDAYIKASLYQRSADLNPNSDAAKLSHTTALKYTKNLATEYYKEGEKFERLNNYELASQNFQKAQEAHKNYGPYKDSAQRFRTNDEKWRKKYATSLISSAKAAENSGFGKKESYRIAAHEYQRAYETYAPYGNIENSKALAQNYQQKGIVRYQYHIAANNMNQYCSYDFSHNLKNETGQKIDYILQNKGFRPANTNPNDWNISIMYELYYKQLEPTDILFIKATIQSTGIINEAEIVMTDINTEQKDSSVCRKAQKDIAQQVDNIIYDWARKAQNQ